jgi:ribosomal protein S18 acetylase RimI-like enzyme
VPKLLELLLTRAAERSKIFGHDQATVRAGAIPTERQWISVLTGAGFALLKQHARMAMSLADASAVPPAPPTGVTVRPVDPADEAELRRFHATIEAAFADTDHAATDFDTWQGRIATESSVSYDEWFVGEVDGEWAGVLQSSDATREDCEGWIRFLAVLRAYRRKGVGEALLRRAFAAYAGKGLTQAGLGVDLANPTQAARLYRAVGMAPKYEANIYQRAL